MFTDSLCNKNINANHKALNCTICKLKIHIKCNSLSITDFNQIKNSTSPFYCITCIDNNIPFSSINDYQFVPLITKGISINEESSGVLTPLSPQVKTHITNLNSFLNRALTSEDDNEQDNCNSTDDDMSSPLNCNYYDLDEFNKAKFNSSKSLSILHYNIHSINKHIDQFRTLIKLLHSDNFEFDIIAISESKINNKSAPPSDIKISNYHEPVSTPSEANKGGVLLYVNKNINFIPRPDLNIYSPKLLESAFIEIKNDNRSNTIVGVIYRHPSMDADDFNTLYLNPLMTKLNRENNKKICIAGDFNINLLNMSSHASSSEFFDILTSNHFLPSISLPTKLNTVNDTLIDNIYTNIFNPDIISGNITFNVGDGHLPSFVIIPNPNQNHLPKKHNFFKYSTKIFNNSDQSSKDVLASTTHDLGNIDWDHILHNGLDANQSFDVFQNKINPIIEKIMPLRKMSNVEHKRRYKPWVTYAIRKSMRRRDRLLRKYIKAKNPARKAPLHTEYKSLRNSIIQLTKQSKLNFYNDYFTSNNGNLRKVWQGIKDIINVKNQSFNVPTSIIDDEGNIVTEPSDISNVFCKQFSTVADKILRERKYEGDGDYYKYLPPPNPSSLASFDPIQVEEVKNIINKFNTRKGTGPASIPSIFLAYFSNELASPLSKIANISFSTGTHPDKLKVAQVIPIFKKGCKLTPSNYRPISLLSNINKILEKLVFSRVLSFLDSEKIIYKHQYGFRPKHSTNHALINITETIRDALDRGKLACGVFVDFQKAFDTVNHSILINKLDNCGIRGDINKWFTSYLSQRKQYVSISGFKSRLELVNHGVPQGSVLGPLLFLLYINDLHNSIQNAITFHFADDTNLLSIVDKHPQNKSPVHTLQSRLNRDLKSLCNWLLANKISLNATKTELIIFRKPLQNIPTPKIVISGIRLAPVSKIKYLGIYLDEYLNGSDHCKTLHSKLQRANGMLAKIRHYFDHDSNELKSIYHSIFSSHMIYGCQTWGLTDNKYINKIQTLQNTALRLISFSESPHPHVRAHMAPILKKFRLLKFRDYVTLKNLLFIHDYFNNKLPVGFNGYFIRVGDIHTHNTRNASRGRLYVPDTDSVRYGRNSFKLKSILAWNHFAQQFPEVDLLLLSHIQLKNKIIDCFINSY